MADGSGYHYCELSEFSVRFPSRRALFHETNRAEHRQLLQHFRAVFSGDIHYHGLLAGRNEGATTDEVHGIATTRQRIVRALAALSRTVPISSG